MNLINKIDKWLLEGEGRKRERHYPSDVTKCTRQLFYKWTSTKPSNPIEAGAMWKMRAGDALHEMIMEFIDHMGYEIIQETAGRQKYRILQYEISYRMDGIFIDPSNDDICGLEIKTSFGRGIKEIQKKQEPKQSDIAQVIMYMELEHFDRFYLFYFGRDNAYRTQFEFIRKADGIYYNNKKSVITFDQLLDKLNLIEYYVDNNKLPEREFKVAIKNGEIKDKFQKNNIMYSSPWQCRYCSYANHCWKEDLETYKNSDNSETLKGTEIKK